MGIIGNVEAINRRAIVANIRDHTDDPGQPDDELTDDTLRLVGGGIMRREVYVDISYDDSGEPCDFIYIDIAY